LFAQGLNLIGGPYSTCAPGPHYIHFKQGETYYLLLDRMLPDDTQTVVLTWRCRIFKNTHAELDALLQRTNDQRTRMVERHRQLFPQAMVQAEAMLPAARTAADLHLPAATSYPVLACLRLLLSDPENFRSCESKGAEKIQSLSSPAIPTEPGKFITGDSTTPWQSHALDQALTDRAKSHPKETVDFNRQLLIRDLVDETGMSDAKASEIASDPFASKTLTQVQESPLAFDLDLNLRSQEKGKALPRLMRTASLLLITADEADDRMVWRSFGLGDSVDLDTELFIPLVARRPDRFSQSWGAINLLLAMPDPRLAQVVKKIMLQTENDSRLSSFFSYFARLKDEPCCLETLAKFERVTAKQLTALTDPDQRQRSLDFTSYLVGKLTEAANKNQLKSEPLHQNLKRLSELYPKKIEPKAPGGDVNPFAN
jgi:hypothetical protein